jgi:hypothetical protein
VANELILIVEDDPKTAFRARAAMTSLQL